MLNDPVFKRNTVSMKNLTQLRWLCIDGCHNSVNCSLPTMSNLTNLTHLCLSSERNRLKMVNHIDISPLISIKSLTSLGLSGYDTEDIGLRHFPNITSLDITDTSDFHDLSRLPYLRQLFVSPWQVSMIEEGGMVLDHIFVNPPFYHSTF